MRHVTVAWGRDYGDVCPIKGVFLGGGSHWMSVAVDVVPVNGICCQDSSSFTRQTGSAAEVLRTKTLFRFADPLAGRLDLDERRAKSRIAFVSISSEGISK